MARRNLRPQTVEEMFHFRPSLSLGHLVARPQRGSSAVRRRGVGGIRFAGKAADLLMLERMVMRALNFYRATPFSTALTACMSHRLTVIQSMLPGRQPRVTREDAAGDGRVVAIATGEHGRGRARIVAAPARPRGDFRVGKGIWLTGRGLLRVVHLLHPIGADDRGGSGGVGLTGFPRIWAQRRRLLQGCGCTRTANARRARADSSLALQAEGNGAL